MVIKAQASIEIPVFMSGQIPEINLQEKSADSATIFWPDGQNQTIYPGKSVAPKVIVLKEEVSAITFQNGSQTSFLLHFNPMPGWLSIAPPLLAILLAVLIKEVLISLFLGVFSGVLLVSIYSFGTIDPITAPFRIMDLYVITALNDSGHLSVIVFSMLIGGMVAIITKNGGMAGFVNRLSPFAKSKRSTQFITWLLGLLIFFDDYANTLVVGNTMRPLTDKWKISREKLAYLVDSTAAPVASIAFVTTWIGAQLGYIEDGIKQLEGLDGSAYQMFINSLSYAFYPILTLGFMLLLIYTGKDFGPMKKAEEAAEKNQLNQTSNENDAAIKELEPRAGTKQQSINALFPIAILIFGTLAGLLFTGWDSSVWQNPNNSFINKLSQIVGAADSYKSLLWSSMAALATAIGITAIRKILSLHETMNIMVKGFGFMLHAILILTLAWTLSSLTDALQTASFITDSFLAMELDARLLPAITFISAALVAFSTGSSWSTMAILYPIMLPAAWALGLEQQLAPEINYQIFYLLISCVLGGAVLGDHCSPISDTTILSSLASSCNHLKHVRTQMPYALSVGSISLIICILPSSFGLNPFLAFILGTIAILILVLIFGTKSKQIE